MATFHLTGAIFKKSVILRTQPTKHDLNYLHPHVDNWRLGFGHSLDIGVWDFINLLTIYYSFPWGKTLNN